MSVVCSSGTISGDYAAFVISSPPSTSAYASFSFPLASSSAKFSKFKPRQALLSSSSLSCDRRKFPVCLNKSSEEEAEVSEVEDEWLQRLPDKTKPLYSHSLPSLEAWLRSLGFYQSKEDRAVWFVEKPDWHAQLSLDVTDLYIRYLKTGPGNLEKDMERRFSYALSREDIENAILGGP
ncbi:OLC1v1027558C1 [Oldenlandia corymbosa var. corymbosa]|uniref:OLC1v1027558C1 n=1 Tax=Oldenlandia corymbosa var. corymbosa TaxID=529605 RepID=A0AAV1CCH2_OLDCO|nr:OLC1v1027558C1 [Oldenlandia corymbosa var. corymbosa]